jgi:DMSO/TMAO reductase YedYZ molybdopterin-dependent catalytic subunit
VQLHPGDRRVVVRGDPFNAEAPFAALDSFITPIDDFYVRSNFPVPAIEPDTWELTIDGRVERSLRFSLDDLAVRPQRTVTCTLECAGNNRTRLAPIPEGEPWGIGAISTGTFTGVSLTALLDEAGVRPGAIEVRFEGADRGTPRGQTREISFERSLPIDVARGNDILLALRMNDAPLTPDHGAPVRLLVPGWYGMASVKWLRRIEVLDHALEAHFQTRQYRFHGPDESAGRQAPPVTTVRVNSMITSIGSGESLGPGGHDVRGVAWSGDAPISAVELSVDAGPWSPATLIGEAVPFAWRRWRFEWPGAPIGRHSLRTRATAADGSTQPDRPDWNRLGYGNNAVALTLVEIVAAA